MHTDAIVRFAKSHKTHMWFVGHGPGYCRDVEKFIWLTKSGKDENYLIYFMCSPTVAHIYIYICMLVVLMWCKAGALSLFARPNKVVLAAAFAVDVEGLEVERTKSTAG